MGVLAGSRTFEASKLQAARASKISLVARRGLREDETLNYVRFGSKADIGMRLMSALPPKADIGHLFDHLSAAISPFEGWKFWANSAWTHARFVNFDQWSGNTPPDVAPIIVNAGASDRKSVV